MIINTLLSIFAALIIAADVAALPAQLASPASSAPYVRNVSDAAQRPSSGGCFMTAQGGPSAGCVIRAPSAAQDAPQTAQGAIMPPSSGDAGLAALRPSSGPARNVTPELCAFNVCEWGACTGDPFDQACAPCSEDDALIYADPDIDPTGAALGRMVCVNLGDLLGQGIRGAVAFCAAQGGMLIGWDDYESRPLCARFLSPNP